MTEIASWKDVYHGRGNYSFNLIPYLVARDTSERDLFLNQILTGFPTDVPLEYKELFKDCWKYQAKDRPCADQVYLRLVNLNRPSEKGLIEELIIIIAIILIKFSYLFRWI